MSAAEGSVRFVHGLSLARAAGCEQRVSALVEHLGAICPALGEFIVEFLVGDLFARPGLDVCQRELLTVAIMASQGGLDQELRFHLNVALDMGIEPAQLVETLLHVCGYAGFPRAVSALNLAQSVFLDRGVLMSGPDEKDAACASD
jgi:4-carboxymuconolactone decarboxylase